MGKLLEWLRMGEASKLRAFVRSCAMEGVSDAGYAEYMFLKAYSRESAEVLDLSLGRLLGEWLTLVNMLS